MTTSVPGAALRRTIRRRSAPAESHGDRCGLCNAVVLERHRHVLDQQRDQLLCACQACTLLFEREAAGHGHYRLVPQHRTRLTEFDSGRLCVPVGLAFFVLGRDGQVTAHYPSAIGHTRAQVEQHTWRLLAQRCPVLGELQAGVQALLVNNARGRTEHWIVPIDECYRLVALIKRQWRGLSGGDTVWPAIDQFFAALADHSR